MGGCCGKKVSIAICSRDSEEHYRWLQYYLEERMFHHTRVKVHPVYISNNTDAFHKEVSNHHFAILYHTKKRGRINVTNVSDALYDDELKYLNKQFGRKKVAVVIDDLEKSNDNEKYRIAQGQKDLEKLSCDLFLFSEAEKKHIDGLGNGEVMKKLKTLKKNIKTA